MKNGNLKDSFDRIEMRRQSEDRILETLQRAYREGKDEKQPFVGGFRLKPVLAVAAIMLLVSLYPVLNIFFNNRAGSVAVQDGANMKIASSPLAENAERNMAGMDSSMAGFTIEADPSQRDSAQSDSAQSDPAKTLRRFLITNHSGQRITFQYDVLRVEGDPASAVAAIDPAAAKESVLEAGATASLDLDLADYGLKLDDGPFYLLIRYGFDGSPEELSATIAITKE